MTDDLDTGMVGETGEAEEGTPTPSDLAERLRKLEQENAKLREERRAERAERLGVQHGLTPTEVELLKVLPADQMEAKAQALAEERAKLLGQRAAEPEPQPPEELKDFDKGPEAPPPSPPTSLQDEMLRRISEAQSFDEIQRLQEEWRRRQLAESS